MKYAIYARKSTDTEDKQVLSLESQINELKHLAEAHNLDVIEILHESMSAKEPGRPIFNTLMSKVISGEIEAILCWKIDRLTRNPVDGGQIQWLLQNGKIKCITTFEKTYLPHDNVLIMSIEQAMANQYIRELSLNVKRGNRAKLDKGEWPHHAPFGYLNDKATKLIVTDPIRGMFVSRIFSLYLTGSYSLKEISETLYAEGLRTNSGKKVYKGNIKYILSNIFYTGLMQRDGKTYSGKHEALITRETYDRVQDLMKGRNRPRPKTLFFPLRGFLKCANCGCALTASLKKGHHYYYCTGNRDFCNEHKSYMREVYLYEEVSKILNCVAFSERKIELMYNAAKAQLESSTDYSNHMIENLQKQLQGLQTKESLLLDTFLAEQISKALYDSKIQELQNERVALTRQIVEAEKQNPAVVLEPTKKVFLEACRAKKEFLDGDDLKKRNILENFCWNLSLKEKNIHTVSLKSPYDIMFKAPKDSDISNLLTTWYEVGTFLHLSNNSL